MFSKSVRQDFKRIREYGGVRFVFSKSMFAVLLMRVSLLSPRLALPLVIISKLLLFFLFKIEVSRFCKVGGGLVLPHPQNIIIGSQEIGENCTIMSNVTLGAQNPDPGLNLPRPILKERVFVGVGAVILGSVNLGADVKIGANAVITKSVSDGLTAYGVNKIATPKVDEQKENIKL